MVMSARPVRAPAEIKAAEFKAKCLELMDAVARTGDSIVITKRGVPVARLVPAAEHAESIFGFAKGSFEETGDILSPVAPEWRPDEHEIALLGRSAPRRSRRRATRPQSR